MLKGSLMAKIAVSPLVSARLYQPILSSDPYQEPRCFSNPKTFGSWLRPVRFLRRGRGKKVLLHCRAQTAHLRYKRGPDRELYIYLFPLDYKVNPTELYARPALAGC